jgi:hypothetical protein
MDGKMKDTEKKETVHEKMTIPHDALARMSQLLKLQQRREKSDSCSDSNVNNGDK